MICNTDLINHLINRDSLKSSNIIEAFRHINREDFILDIRSGSGWTTALLSLIVF